ncbi:hypothetical protein WJX72_009447 [[Myrmecia] bisecta]|uniref:Meiotic nuclear division protein 1 homolog n=1 Tax=[Myrmecia] bisecta TaxID=41462 RepID=A0AAW1PTV2_9CHLO
MSLEEKREALLGIFHDTRDVFVLKDIEKLGSKKGVVLQSVKEVLQGLVDDDLVHQERIGASNFFWSFPSEAAVKLHSAVAKLEKQIADNAKQREDLESKLAQAKQGKEDSADRSSKLAELQGLQQQAQKLDTEVAAYADSDPEKLEAMKQAVEVAKDASSRWLDNIEALRGWCKNRFQGMEDQLDGFFRENGVADDME